MPYAARLFPQALAIGVLSLLAQPSQPQRYLARYDVYAGYAELSSPALGLDQNGFNLQAGMNLRQWLSEGFDYSWSTGSELLTTGLLPPSLQVQVNGAQQQYIAVGILPQSYRLAVPTDATTQTFALGPQLAIRHWSAVSLFLRPSLGALRERAVPHPRDPFATLIVQQLAPAGFKRDWTGFYGLGGGGDLPVTRHLGLRLQLDAVHDHPFNDILDRGRWTFRISAGPALHVGRNIGQR